MTSAHADNSFLFGSSAVCDPPSRTCHSWECSGDSATLNDVPAGTSEVLKCEAASSDSTLTSRDTGKSVGFSLRRYQSRIQGAHSSHFGPPRVHTMPSSFLILVLATCLLSIAIVQARGEVTQLLVSQQPQDAVASESFVGQPQVFLLDEAGKKDVGFTQLRASVSGNSTQLLGGTTFITAVNGTADFSDLYLARAEKNMILRFTLDGSSTVFVDSSGFDVMEGVSALDVITSDGYEEVGIAGKEIVAGRNLTLCETGEVCISLYQFCNRFNYSDPEILLGSRYNVTKQNCTDLEEDELLGGILTCRLQTMCNFSTPMQVAVLDESNGLVGSTRTAVFASVIPQGDSVGALLGTPTASSCCRHETCSSIYSACCDCSLPECGLCVIPENGIATFPAIRVEKAGVYSLRFETKQFRHTNDDVTMPRLERSIDAIDSILFDIVPDAIDSLQVTVQPASILPSRRPPGATIVRLVPQPQVSFTDKFGNPTEDEILGVVVAHLCYDDLDTAADPAPDLCRCLDTDCWFQPNLTHSVAKAQRFLNGTVTAGFQGNTAVYRDLGVTVARSDLRIVVHMFQDGLAAAPFVMTNVFQIAAGEISILRVVDDPSVQKGCPRCPVGVHFVGEAIPAMSARVKLYDATENLVTTHELEVIVSTLYLIDENGAIVASAADAQVGPPRGILSAEVRQGVASFALLRVSKSAKDYRYEFSLQSQLAISTLNAPGLRRNFTVVNGRPAKVRALGPETLYSADQEVILRQPQLELLDSFDNRVVSDCYMECGRSQDECDPAGSGCPEQVTASLVLIPGAPPSLGGTRTVFFEDGVATFTDLFVDTGSPECMDAKTVEFTLQFSVALQDGQPMEESTDTRQLVVQRRVTQLFILVYPTRVVARERFQVPPQILVRDCKDESVENATAAIEVSIRDDAGGGVLSGDKLVPLDDGSASFHTISIDLFGDGYSLQFAYLGNADVATVVSTAFSVLRSSSRLKLHKDLNGTVTTANETLVAQPVVGIYDSSEQLVDLSTAQIVASIFDNPGNLQAHDPGRAKLLGTTTINAKRGIAAFTDLRIDKANIAQGIDPLKRYTLVFALQEVIVVSGEFDIAPARAMRNLIVSNAPDQAPTPDLAGNVLAVQPLIYLTDAFRNRLDPAFIAREHQVDLVLEKQDSDGIWTSTTEDGTLIQNSCLVEQAGLIVSGVQCEGEEPERCTNIGDCQLATKDGRLFGFARWTDLRIDLAATYRFRFIFEGSPANEEEGLDVDPPTETTSEPFMILNARPSYAFMVQQLAPVNVADEILKQQPQVTVKDKYGNKVVVDTIANRYVSVQLVTAEGLLPTQPPDPVVPGQAVDSVCRLAPTLFEGNTTVAVDLTTGDGTFTDLAVRQAMSDYRLVFTMPTSTGIKTQESIAFTVEAGWAVGLCNMSLPSLCQSKSPCLSGGRVVCVDSYGNVQPSCLAFFYGDFTGSPFTIPDTAHVDCRSSVCARLIEASSGAVLSSQALNGGTDCSKTFCQAQISQGFATFDDLTVSAPGIGFVLEFRTYVWNAYIESAYEWTFVTPAFNVTPVAPAVSSVKFDTLVNRLFVKFDRMTNMNNWPTEGRDSSCTREIAMSTVEALGHFPYCTWITEDTYVMSVGANAYVNETTVILLNPLSQITASEVVNGVLLTSLPAITIKGRIIGGFVLRDIFPELPAVLPQPKAVMFGPSAITSCDTINVNGARSYGFAGRQFQKFAFRLDLAHSQTSQGVLTSGSAPEPTFSKRRLHLGDPVPGMESLVTVTLRPDAAVLPGTNLTITGLPVYNPASSCNGGGQSSVRLFDCPEGKCFASPLMGPDAHKFEGVVDRDVPQIRWADGAVPTVAILRMRADEGNFLSDIEDTVLQFLVTNPLTAIDQVPAPVDVTASCVGCICQNPACSESLSLLFQSQTNFRMDCDQYCLNEVGAYFLPAKNISIRSAAAFESTDVNGAVNTITLEFVLSESLGAGGEIVLSNITIPAGTRVCLFGQNASVFECENCRNLTTPYASVESHGVMRMKLVEGSVLTRFETARIHFRVTNPTSEQRDPSCAGSNSGSCPSLVQPQIGVRYAQHLPIQLQPLPGNILGAGGTEAFSEAMAIESNELQNSVTWIQVRFAAKNDILNGTRIEVSGLYVGNMDGLVGTSGVNDSIPLFGENETAACFTFAGLPGYGFLDPSTGLLSLQVADGCQFETGRTTTLFLKMRNALSTQPGYSIGIKAWHDGCSSCVNKYCPCIGMMANPMSIPLQEMAGDLFTSSRDIRIERGSISESNGVPGQPNKITISVFLSVPVQEGTSLTISGFQSTLSVPTQNLTINFGNSTNATIVYGLLNYVGNVTVTVPHEYEANEEIRMEFEVRNGFTTASGVFAVSGYAILDLCQNFECPAYLDSRANETMSAVTLTGEALLLTETPQVLLATIKESTRVLGAINVLTIRLRFNFELVESSTLEIRGLEHAGTPAVTGLTAISDFKQLYANCSCPVTCETCSQVCDSCTQSDKLKISQQFRLWNPDVDESGKTLFGTPRMVGFHPDGNDVKGYWDPDRNNGVLNVSVARTVPAGTEVLFGFAVSNPQSAERAKRPTVTIEAEGGDISIVDFALDGEALGSDKQAAFTSASISEELSVDAGVSTLRVKFETNCPLLSPQPPGMQISISGLKGFSSPYGDIYVFGADRYNVAISAIARWVQGTTREGGSLVLIGGTVQGACSSIASFEGCAQSDSGQSPDAWVNEFTFYLKRLPGIPVASDPYISARSLGLQTEDFAMTADMAQGELPQPRIVSATISDRQQLASVPNLLTVSFEVNVDLLESSTVTLMGLRGASTESTDFLAVMGQQGGVFGSTGKWDKDAGALKLEVAPGQIVPHDQIVTFAFVITNPVSSQPAAMVSITGAVFAPYRPEGAPTPAGTMMSAVPVVGEVLTASLKPALLMTRIVESTTVNGAMNTLTVSMSANIPLPAGAEMTISGLNSASEPATVNITEPGTAIFGGSGNWGNGFLRLVSQQEIDEAHVIVFSFELQNVFCSHSCPAPVFVNVSGGAAARVLQVETSKVHGVVLGAGGRVSWVTKAIHESTRVRESRNNITFGLQPNAPLYEGTVVVIEGLVYDPQPEEDAPATPETPATPEKVILQPCWGCEGMRPRCFVGGVEVLSATRFELETCEIGVYTRNESIVDRTSAIPAAVFNGTALWDLDAGSLTLTIAPGMVIREDKRTYFSVFLRNAGVSNRQMQCGLNEDYDFQGHILFATGNDCVRVRAPVVNLCATSALAPGIKCANDQLVASEISRDTRAVDHFNTPLLDGCPTCLRQLDLVHVDDILRQQDTLVISDLEVDSPRTQGLSTYIPGGVVPGDYSVVLDLQNWVGVHSNLRTSTYDFEKKRGTGGATRSEIVEPLIYMEVEPDTVLKVDAESPLEITAVGKAALCQPFARFETLQYQWAMECEQESEIFTCILANYTDETNRRTVFIEGGMLPPGALFDLTITATQPSLGNLIDNSPRVTVEVVVRPPQPVITGVNPLGLVSVAKQNVVVYATSSFDPESSVTQMSYVDFTFSWGCEYLDNVTFVPCTDLPGVVDGSQPSSVESAASQGISTANNLTLTPSLLARNGSYRISVSAFRTNATLLEERGLDPLKFGVDNMGYASVNFTLGDVHPLSVEVYQCEDSDVGTSDLCAVPKRSYTVNANERTVLFANDSLTQQTSPSSVLEVKWNTFGVVAEHILQPENLLTSSTHRTLIIRPGVLNPGHTVRFRATLHDRRGGASGYSDIVLTVNVPPLGGMLQVTPSTGTALQTEFQIESQAWTADPEHLPLVYKFFATVGGRITTNLVLARGATQTISAVLPAGDAVANHSLTVRVEVMDARGAAASRNATLQVMPGDASIAELTHSLNLLLAGQDVDAIISGVGSLALTMQDPAECAAEGNNTVTTYVDAPPACQAALDDRREFRKRLLAELQTAAAVLPASADTLQTQAEVLNGIARSPLEIDRATTRAAHAMIQDLMATARGLRRGHKGFHLVAATTMHALFQASRAQAVPAVPGAATNTSTLRRDGTGAARSARVLKGDAESWAGMRLASQAELAQRRASVSADDIAMTLELLDGISKVSSLSVSDQIDGQQAVEVATGLYRIATRRVSLAETTFVPGAQARNPLRMSISGTDTMASVPNSVLDLIHPRTGSGEVMLIEWDFADGPLPQNWGPAVGLQVRRFGESAPLQFPSLEEPLSIDVRSISSRIDAVTGEGFTSFGSYFDPVTWSWKFAGISKAAATTTVVTTHADNFAHFSVVEVQSGCDGQPLSGVILDGCMVCGGANETCSGCDGIPNTGLDRLCSGHGQCGQKRCSCLSNWYGDACSTFCDNLVTCSGHGFCDAAFNGRRCNCMEGWAEGDKTYPGPFCERQIGYEPGLSTPAPYVKEADKAGQLAMILAIVFAVLGVFVVGGVVYWFAWRQRSVAQSFKKTIIDFSADDNPRIGEPSKPENKHKAALLLSADPAPAALPASAPAPDEGTWQADMADATATFSYGPNSGYLASAVAASTRTNMGQLAVERIDRRSRVMKSQIKGRQTLAKYSVPMGIDGDDDESVAMLPQLLPGSGLTGDSGSSNGSGARAFPLVMQSVDGRWEDPFTDPPEHKSDGRANGSGHSGMLPFHSRFADQDFEAPAAQGYDSGEQEESYDNGDGPRQATWQVSQSPEWLENDREARV